MESTPPHTISGLRDFFARNEKDKLSPNLRRALSLLKLNNLDALEERFLATDAFLKPWAVFRDSVFLFWPDAMPCATSIAPKGSTTGITRLDVLWFYTQFDEGAKRYDARADKYSCEYTLDNSVHGVIDKKDWDVEAYEKHMHAWMLQSFKVGKAYSPWGFRFFELQSVCVAWESVLLPIINAVRTSYDVKGKRYYGRLALFVEARCPSRLAFPEDNVGMTQSELLSPTPFRIVSMPKKAAGSEELTIFKRQGGPGILTKKHYDETEKELRDVYPQYGGLVERPKFKQKMEEWLADQRARAEARRALELRGTVQSFKPRIVHPNDEPNLIDAGKPVARPQREFLRDDSGSPIKRTFNSIRRTLSKNVSGQASNELPKGPLHGVTRQLHFSNNDLPEHSQNEQKEASPDAEQDRRVSLESTDTVLITPWPRTEMIREPSEQSVYSSIRNLNPYREDAPQDSHVQELPTAEESLEIHPNNRPGTLGHLLRNQGNGSAQFANENKPLPPLPVEESLAARLPSYEGSGYVDEISLTSLHNRRKQTATPRPKGTLKPPTRLPIPIRPTAYAGSLRIASREPVVNVLPQSLPWPGSEDDNTPAPAVPQKNPERAARIGGLASMPQFEQAEHGQSHSLTRIVSKANIRAAVGGDSRENSTEDLLLAMTKPLPIAVGPAKTGSPGATMLQTYNSHHFPRKTGRKNGSLETWTSEHGKRHEDGIPYETGGLNNERTGPKGGKL